MMDAVGIRGVVAQRGRSQTRRRVLVLQIAGPSFPAPIGSETREKKETQINTQVGEPETEKNRYHSLQKQKETFKDG